MTVAVIGGGASGMMAALTAASDGKNVLLFERQERVGRKLSATGNGRCNLTNIYATAEHYHGDRAFASGILERYNVDMTLEFFHSLGLLTVTESDGRVYPLSNSANSVTDVLRFALEVWGVNLISASPVRTMKKSGEIFELKTDEAVYKADAVIVATGGAAGEKLGGVGDGYKLLKSMGHSSTKLRPSLVQLLTDARYPRALKGVKADATVRLKTAERILCESEGEVLFTERGVSGPAAFDVSRVASFCGDGVVVELDFLREHSFAEVLGLLEQRRGLFPDVKLADVFTGTVQNRLGRMLVKYADISGERTVGSLSDKELKALSRAAKNFCLELSGTEGFTHAQVTAGGVPCSEFHAESLESKLCKGLYACGEVLDIDGDCGGYNLQWAWSSGYIAGRMGTCP